MFDCYLSAYQTIPYNDDQGRPIEYLTPRSRFDDALCGVCASSGRLIYSQRAVVEIIRDDIMAAYLSSKPRVIVPLELARDALSEAFMRYQVLILAPSEEGSCTPLFLDDDRP